jgi:hypothetical protein
MAETPAAEDDGFGRGHAMRWTVPGIAAVAAELAFPAPAYADVDTDFADELHTYGIYDQKEYNAWIGRIVCKRLGKGVDTEATT